MVHFKPPIILLLCLILPTAKSAGIVNDVLDVVALTKDIALNMAKAWNLVDGSVDFSIIPIPLLDKTERKLFAKIEGINDKLDLLSERVDALGANALETIKQTTQQTVRLELGLNGLLNYINRLDVSYQQFRHYTNDIAGFERFTLKDYAKSVVSHNPESVLNAMVEIHAFIVPKENRFVTNTGILSSLSKSMKQVNGDFMCNSKQSPQQVLYNLFNTIALSQLKGYTMGQFAYMILRMYNQGNFTQESKLLSKDFETRATDSLKAFTDSMSVASREIWVCDPHPGTHEQGETYEALTGVMQGYISNEVNLNAKGKCWEDCPDYNYVTKMYIEPGKDTIKDKCNGHIVNCKYVESHMWICPANRSSDRRYEFITYESGMVLGKKNSCPRSMINYSSWTDWLFYCPYCFCLCDQQGLHSDRYFNLRPVFSDMKNNRVVTGLRFVKKNRIIHLTVQEGELRPNGNINSTTLQWVTPQDYHYTDRQIYREQDFHVITFENRGVDLSNLEVDDGYVMTGVRFKLIGTRLSLEIYMTKFNFFTGKLENPEGTSTWKDNTKIPDKSAEIKLNDPDIPTKSAMPSMPISENNQYILFRNSDMYKDAAQTTVSFLDAQKVESYHPVPLAGAGLFYKGRNFYGGFIAPKIITYDFSKYLRGIKKIKMH